MDYWSLNPDSGAGPRRRAAGLALARPCSQPCAPRAETWFLRAHAQAARGRGGGVFPAVPPGLEAGQRPRSPEAHGLLDLVSPVGTAALVAEDRTLPIDPVPRQAGPLAGQLPSLPARDQSWQVVALLTPHCQSLGPPPTLWPSCPQSLDNVRRVAWRLRTEPDPTRACRRRPLPSVSLKVLWPSVPSPPVRGRQRRFSASGHGGLADPRAHLLASAGLRLSPGLALQKAFEDGVPPQPPRRCCLESHPEDNTVPTHRHKLPTWYSPSTALLTASTQTKLETPPTPEFFQLI